MRQVFTQAWPYGDQVFKETLFKSTEKSSLIQLINLALSSVENARGKKVTRGKKTKFYYFMNFPWFILFLQVCGTVLFCTDGWLA